MKVRQFIMLLLVLALAVPALAQEQRGAIEGVVKDSSGGVLPGVTVEAKSAAGVVISSVTDSKGVFRFPAVAPGKYQVQANLTGFKPARVENLEVLLGQIKTVDFSLSIGSLTEEVQVTAEAPLVDTKQSARATSITAEQLDSLPKGRDFMTVVTQAPGANNETKSGGVMIDGATTSENRYIVDGAETSDVVTGGSGKTLIADFIAEVQVKSSGYTAEYGGATGGVINVVTKSGTNNWHGNVLFQWEGSQLQGGRTPTLRLKPSDANQAEYITYAKDGYSRAEPGFSVGGPLFKDKTWFYAAYQPTSISYDRTVTDKTGAAVSATQNQPNQFFTGNNTAQIGSKLHTRVAYNNSWRKTKGALPALDGSDPVGTNYNYGTTYPNWSLSGQADWIAKPNFFVGAKVGYYTADVHSYGISNAVQYIAVNGNTGMTGIPSNLLMTTGQLSIPTNSSTAQDKQQRLQFQLDGTWYGNFAGQHTIKGGFQVDKLANSVDSGNQGLVVRLYWGQAYQGNSGPYGYYRVRSNGALPKKGFITQGDVSMVNYGLFIQDAWTISNKLTLNLGLRTENENIPPYINDAGTPSTAVKFNFADKLAPRLGFAYDIKGDGKWKAYGSWGIFYDIFKMQLPRSSFGGEKWLEYWYTLNTPNWPTLADGASCPPNCPGTLLRGPYDYRAVSLGSDAIDPNLKPMKSMETSFGLEHQLSAVTAVSVRYSHKQLLRAVDDTGSFNESGEVYVVANPGFGMTQVACGPDLGCNPSVALPKAKRLYDSVEFAFQKNMAKNWYFRGSYMWSRLYGNYSGLDQTDENGRTNPNVGRLYDYPLMSFDQHGYEVEGPLATDRPHQLKAQFIYMLPFGTTFGVNEYVATGIPKTREMAVLNPSAYPIFYMGRGSDGRMPVYSQTDLQVSHDFKLSGQKKIQISLNVLNLFNQATATNYFSTENKSGDALSFDQTAFYAHKLDFQQLKAAQKVGTDPRFLMDNGYQTPIQARIGFKFLF
jgi:hypothetical protein